MDKEFYLQLFTVPWSEDMGMPSLHEYPLYLGIVIVLKTLFLWLLLRKHYPFKKICLAGVVTNLVSHPLSYFGSVLLSMNFHIPWGFTSMVALGWTVLLETSLLRLFLKRLSWSSAVLYVLLAQLLTLVVGLVIGRSGI